MIPQLAGFTSAQLCAAVARKVDPSLQRAYSNTHTLADEVMLHSHCFSVRSQAHHMFIGLNGENVLKQRE